MVRLLVHLLLGIICIKPFFYAYQRIVIRLVVYCDVESQTIYDVMGSDRLSLLCCFLFMLVLQLAAHKALHGFRYGKMLILFAIGFMVLFQGETISINPLKDGGEDSRSKIIVVGATLRDEVTFMPPADHVTFKLSCASRRVRPYEVFDLSDIRGYAVGKIENESTDSSYYVSVSLGKIALERLRICRNANSYERMFVSIDGHETLSVPMKDISKFGKITIRVDTKAAAYSLENKMFTFTFL